MKTPRTTLLACLLMTSIVLGRSLLGGFVWDDVPLIVSNPHDFTWSQLWLVLSQPFFRVGGKALAVGYYRPVIGLSYFLQQQLFGQTPVGYHLISLLLHFMCVALAFAWLRERLATAEDDADSTAVLTASAFATLFFAVHPTKPEVVSWISGCTDLWMTLFVLLAMRAAHRGRVVLAALYCALAALSKETGFVVPLLLAADAFWLRDAEGQLRSRKLRAALACALALLPVLLLRTFVVTTPARALRAFWSDLPGRVFWSLGEYVSALVWPFHSTALRGELAFSPDGVLRVPPDMFWLGVLASACLALVLVASIASRGKHALAPFVADLGWFVIALLPVVNVLRLGLDSLVAERFLYLPSLGLAAFLGRALLAAFAQRGPVLRALLLTGAGAALAACAFATSARAATFASNDTFWAAERARHPDDAFVFDRLASLANDQGRYADALRLAEAEHVAALRARLPHLEARSVLFAALALLSSLPDVEQAQLTALRDFYDDLGAGRTAKLMAAGFTLSEKLDRASAAALREEVTYYLVPRAIAHARTLELEPAIALFRAAQKLDPQNSVVLTQLALTLARAGRYDEALANLSAPMARGASPDVVRGLGGMLLRAREISLAPAPNPLADAERSAQLFLMLGAPELARRTLEPWLTRAPDEPSLIRVRCIVDAADRRPDLARARLDAARARWPERAPAWDMLAQELEALAQRGKAAR